jgi:hypothetical protein
MSKDPSDSGVDLCVVKHAEKGRSRQLGLGYIHSHLLLVEWLDAAADKGLQEVHAHQPTS